MVVGRVAASVAQRQVRHVAAVPPHAATGLVAAVYEQVADEMRLVIPPALLHSPSPPVLAAYWLLTREALLPVAKVERAAKEAVAAAASVAAVCPYCVDMHSVGLYDLATEPDAEAVAADQIASMTDPRLRSLAAWARVAHLADEPLTRRPPFTADERPELVGVVVAFHFLTRMVNVFLGGNLIPASLGPAVRRRFKRGVGRLLRPTLRQPYAPGRSLDLLPAAPVPPDALWAKGNESVTDAVARAYAALDAAGERAVPPPVRQLVEARLDRWRGEPTGLSRDWCERIVGDLPSSQRATGRLALLTALASHQVDDVVIGQFKTTESGESDSALIDITAWASFAAARRVGRVYQ